MSTIAAVCPYCGQTLLDRDAVDRLQKARASQQRELERLATTKADSLVDDRLARERAKAEKEAAKKQDQRVKALEGALESTREKNIELERRLQKLSAKERGDLHEVDVFEQLTDAFREDKLERRGKGADIHQAVYYQAGRTVHRAGLVVYECKDTIRWQNAFIAQIKKAGAAENTPYLVLVTRAYPKGESTVCVREGVIIVQPSQVRAIADIVRRMVIQAHRAGVTADGRDEKTARLFEYLTSNEFRQAFGAVVQASDAMRILLSEEKRAHERVWTRREQAYTELERKASAVDESIRAIIEDSSRPEAKIIPIGARAKAG